jgi:hypothetical protein
MKLPTEFRRSNDDSEGGLSFGKAIYFSSYSSKACSYGDGTILVCDLIPGRVRVCLETEPGLTQKDAQKHGFDTIFYDGNLYQSRDKKILEGTSTDEYACFYSD